MFFITCSALLPKYILIKKGPSTRMAGRIEHIVGKVSQMLSFSVKWTESFPESLLPLDILRVLVTNTCLLIRMLV